MARWLLLDLDGALADATAVEDGARLYGGQHQVLLSLWLLALVRHHRGEAGAAERAADGFTALADSLPPCEPVRAGACTLATIHAQRDPERCLRDGLRLAGADFEHAEHGWAGSALPALVRAALAAGRTDDADRWATKAAQRTLGLPAARVRAHLARAELLLARGAANEAAATATAAAAFADSIPAPLDAAEARLLAGRAFALAGDDARAKRELQRVAADAGRGHAGRLRDAASRELRRLGTRVSGAGRRGTHEPLTERERRIARLVATGGSNKDVAATLFLSTKTIENALTRIYAKLGVDSRTQLGDALTAAHDGHAVR
jgi:ATP/maltotriose-dependent transcriptional regulator MalT